MGHRDTPCRYDMKRLVLATGNPGKVAEIKELLRGRYDEIVTLRDLGLDIEVEEDGANFEENAIKKAVEISKQVDGDVLADDSGLSVTALGGRPGVRSARFAGENASDAQNNALLLEQMRGVEDRSAEFVCCIVLANSGKVKYSVEGRVRGEIADELAGGGGFGYDPLFFLPEEDMTFAQISLEDKNKISHRSIALKKLQQLVQDSE